MKFAHNVKISVFCKEYENETAIIHSLKSLFPFYLEKEKIKLNQQTATGFNETKIKIFDIILDKERHINKFLGFLKEKLSAEQKGLLIRQAESRLDEKLDFFIRFDKDKLIQENKLYITDSGNCFHIKISIAAFPSKREKALEAIKTLFGNANI